MPELHLLPNVEYLHTIEDEIYEYAVNHPEEYISRGMEEGSIDFVHKMGILYRFGEHNKTACEVIGKIRRGEDTRTARERIEDFIHKHPQWKKLYYY